MVLLVLKLFVSNRPLKLESILCIYVLLLPEGQAKYHFAMFFYMVKTNNWLSIFWKGKTVGEAHCNFYKLLYMYKADPKINRKKENKT
jgi:hypothetical protein